MDKENQIRRYSIIAIIISATIVIATKLIIPIAKALNAPPMVSITTAPIQAVTIINGKEYRNGVYTDIQPGTYTAVIKAPNFDDKSVTLEVKPHKDTQILTYLNHQKEGLKYFERNRNDIKTIRKIDEPEIKDFIAQYDKKLEIKSKLPQKFVYQDKDPNAAHGRNNFAELTLDDGSQSPICQYDFCLRIRYNGAREDAAKAKVKEIIKNYRFKEEEYHTIYEKI